MNDITFYNEIEAEKQKTEVFLWSYILLQLLGEFSSVATSSAAISNFAKLLMILMKSRMYYNDFDINNDSAYKLSQYSVEKIKNLKKNFHQATTVDCYGTKIHLFKVNCVIKSIYFKIWEIH